MPDIPSYLVVNAANPIAPRSTGPGGQPRVVGALLGTSKPNPSPETLSP